MSRRPIAIAALGAAGIGGYYLYSAGGDPKIAQKQVQREHIKILVLITN